MLNTSEYQTTKSIRQCKSHFLMNTHITHMLSECSNIFFVSKYPCALTQSIIGLFKHMRTVGLRRSCD